MINVSLIHNSVATTIVRRYITQIREILMVSLEMTMFQFFDNDPKNKIVSTLWEFIGSLILSI